VPFGRCSHRARRLWATAESSSGCRRAAVQLRCAYFVRCWVSSDRRRAHTGFAPAIRPPAAAIHRMAGRWRRYAGVGRALGAEVRSTIGCSTTKIHTRRTTFSILNPTSLEFIAQQDAAVSAALRRPLSVRASQLLQRRPRLEARRARLQPRKSRCGTRGQEEG
jgi:hypothetical protein